MPLHAEIALYLSAPSSPPSAFGHSEHWQGSTRTDSDVCTRCDVFRPGVAPPAHGYSRPLRLRWWGSACPLGFGAHVDYRLPPMRGSVRTQLAGHSTRSLPPYQFMQVRNNDRRLGHRCAVFQPFSMPLVTVISWISLTTVLILY